MRYKLKESVSTDIIERICENRGITLHELDNFINVPEHYKKSPKDYLNMSLAYRYIIEAIEGNDKIGVLVDSDVDGYCSAAMFINYVKKAFNYDNFEIFIHKNKGHGLSEEMVETILNSTIDFLFISDAGSNDFGEQRKLYENGIDIVIIDHHECLGSNPDYAVIVNNQLCRKANKFLSGAGMVMKLLEFIDMEKGFNYAKEYMDLCAIALVADSMPMSNMENRYYVQEGLKGFKNPLLQELYNSNKSRNFELISYDLAPALNAFTRVATIEEKRDLFDALIEKSDERELTIRGLGKVKLNLSEYIARLVPRIKSRQTSCIDKALSDSNTRIITDNLPIVICVLDNSINQSLSGLIGNKLAEIHKKPAIVLREMYGDYRGSGRTVKGFNNFKDYLNSFNLFFLCQGHQQAFGVGISIENFNSFIEKIYCTNLDGIDTCYLVDEEYIGGASAYDILEVDRLKDYWSKGFEKPLFYIEVNEPVQIDIIGKNNNTIRIKHNYITYIKFQCSLEEVEHVRNLDVTGIKIIGTFNVNEWNGRDYPQVFIEKMKVEGREYNSFFNFIN